MNIELLQKIKNSILEEPRRVNMDVWVRAGLLEEEEKASFLSFSDHTEVPPCGTVACIAGWALVITGEDKVTISPFLSASRLLDLNIWQGERLFYPSNWPRDLQAKLFKEQPGTEGYAIVVAETIDRFIELGGRWPEGEVDEMD